MASEMPEGWSVIAPIMVDTGAPQTIQLKITRPDGTRVLASACLAFDDWRASLCQFIHVLAQIEETFGRPLDASQAYTDIQFSKDPRAQVREDEGTDDEDDDWESEGEEWKG